MNEKLIGVFTVVAVGCAVFAGSALLGSGCYYEVCPECPVCGDAGADSGDGGDGGATGECAAPAEEVGINAWPEGTSSSGIDFIRQPGNYVTLLNSGQVTATAVLDPEWERPLLPDSCIDPISYTWDWGNGQTATGESPGAATYSAPGYYTATLTAAIAAGQQDVTPAPLYVTVWNGTFSDNFDRAAIDLDADGWSYRTADILNLDPSAPWDIQDNMLHADWGSEGLDLWCAPGRQAMLARPQVQDARVQVVQRRGNPTAGVPHYSDIILRYSFLERTMAGPVSPFYRVRIHEAADHGGTDCTFIDVFRIGADAPGQEFGQPLEAEDSHSICNWPRGDGENLLIDISITGTNPVTIDVSVASSSSPGTHTLTHTFTDSADNRITDAGRFGVSQCWGETFFDDFRLTAL